MHILSRRLIFLGIRDLHIWENERLQLLLPIPSYIGIVAGMKYHVKSAFQES